MVRPTRASRFLPAWPLMSLLLFPASLLTGSPPPAKLLALFPKDASEISSSEINRMEFMTHFSSSATLPATRSCNRNTVTPHAIFLEVNAFNIRNEIGVMQADMIPLTSRDQIQSMRRQLEKVRDNWKGLNIGSFTAIREEKVGKGTILMIRYTAPCADVNPDRSESEEVRARAYFWNGRTEAKLEFANRCSEAEARAVITALFEKIDQADFQSI